MAARRRPGYTARQLADDPADVARKVEARAALLDLLTQDARIRTAWRAWTQTPAAHLVLARLMVPGDPIRVRVGDPDSSGLVEVGDTLLAAIPEAPKPAWLPSWLGGMALRWALAYLNDGALEPWAFRLARPWDTRATRTTKRDRVTGQTTVRRDVGWYYRAELKSPPDSIRQIARDYATSDPNYTRADARSLVRDGITRAKQALEIM